MDRASTKNTFGRILRRAVMILSILVAALPACAKANLDLSVDPRFELLGVVRQLSELTLSSDGMTAHQLRVQKHFTSFRRHPVIELYKNLGADASREEASAMLLLYYSNPPELDLMDRHANIHYVNGPGQAAEMHRFLHELRDFSRASDFTGFFRANRSYYRQIEEAARRTHGRVEPLTEIESYLGVRLASRSHYYLPALPLVTHAFIVPYPLPPASSGAGSFDIFTVASDLHDSSFSNVIWHEPLFVFVDPSFYYFEKLNIPVPEDFYGEEVARCRRVGPDCVKNFAVSALIEHLNRKTGVLQNNSDQAIEAHATLESRLVTALSTRLDEYDANRDLYPTLWEFLPRWFSVYEEAAFPGRKPSKLSVPAGLKIKAATDFFTPLVSRTLLRGDAR